METVRILELKMEFIAPEMKRPNRAERAIRTAKNHIIATRAGFHPDCSHAYLDKCLPQIVITLNLIHPFEYNDSISTYHGVHPIAALGCKVLIWDSPDNRGSRSDHGIERSNIYRARLGSLQSFERLDFY
jgi:hypothetical protein